MSAKSVIQPAFTRLRICAHTPDGAVAIRNDHAAVHCVAPDYPFACRLMRHVAF
ncbi:MAG: hypothetical protein LBJ59_05130 [Zoogloeaceae bacterium]|nr:hypothetical protein [Zoogloeaceae bacterium]